MRRLSALDHLVRNFQHNWETNPQFRAIWSGGLGLVIVVMLCACLGFAFTFAGTAAAAFSGNSSPATAAGPSGTARPGSVDSTITFPTETIPPWGAQQAPASSLIPPSLTPLPTPTAMPTPTPVPFTTGGGGGGGGGGGTVTVISATFIGGQNGSVVVQTSVPNAQVNIFVYWPNGTQAPQNPGTTNGSGIGTVSTSPAPQLCNGTVKMWIVTDVSGSGHFSATCSG